MSRSAPLARVLCVSALSAGAAFYAAPHVLRIMEGRIRVQNMRPDAMSALGYTAAFCCAFLLLSFFSRHVQITLRPQGLEKTPGFAPKLARLIVVAVIFTAPLGLLLQARLPHDKISLKNIVAEAETRARGESRPGYKKQDRAGLDTLIHKGSEHD